MIKMIALLKRRPELSHDEFIERWVNIHAPLAKKVPGIRKYVQAHIITEQRRADVPEIDVAVDGVAELWFDDEKALQVVQQSAEMRQLLADGATFIGEIKTFIVNELEVISFEHVDA